MITHEIIKVKPTVVYQSNLPWKPAEPVMLPALAVGDWVYYVYAGMHGKIASNMCSVVVEVETDLSNMHIDPGGAKKPYLLMALTGTADYSRAPDYKYKTDPWVRWSDGSNLKVLPMEQQKELADDFVSNYIQTHFPKARSYLK